MIAQARTDIVVTTYPIIRGKQYLRRASRVIFPDGMTVRFFHEFPRAEALAEALKVRARLIAEHEVAEID